ncbi:MAG TPA: hypothetical protein VHG92_13225 [Afifellaceae bacterium]|nr:hypothetical protein [Afifellaceae bacterium]
MNSLRPGSQNSPIDREYMRSEMTPSEELPVLKRSPSEEKRRAGATGLGGT